MLLQMQYLERVFECCFGVMVGGVDGIYKCTLQVDGVGALKTVENIADNVQESRPFEPVKVAMVRSKRCLCGQMRITAKFGKSYITTETLSEQLL
jgi:hypothetical protein